MKEFVGCRPVLHELAIILECVPGFRVVLDNKLAFIHLFVRTSAASPFSCGEMNFKVNFNFALYNFSCSEARKGFLGL